MKQDKIETLKKLRDKKIKTQVELGFFINEILVKVFALQDKLDDINDQINILDEYIKKEEAQQ